MTPHLMHHCQLNPLQRWELVIISYLDRLQTITPTIIKRYDRLGLQNRIISLVKGEQTTSNTQTTNTKTAHLGKDTLTTGLKQKHFTP